MVKEFDVDVISTSWDTDVSRNFEETNNSTFTTNFDAKCNENVRNKLKISKIVKNINHTSLYDIQ